MKRAIYRISLCLATLLPAIGTMAQNGSASYDFLNIPTSTHATALGGSALAVIDDDVNLVQENPALLGSEIEKQIALSYMHWFGSSNFASLRYGMAASERSAWSVGLRYMNFGKIDGYDENGVATGTFTPNDLVFGGSYSHDFNDRLRGGIAVNMIWSTYEQYSALALAADIGINYYRWENDLSFSIVLKNMGGQIKRFSDAYNRLPFDVQLGYMQRLGSSPFKLAITARRLTKWNLPSYGHDENKPETLGELNSGFISNFFKHLTFGLEYVASDNFYIGLGYDYYTRCSFSSYQRNFLSGFSAGLGLRVRNWGFGVAYSQPHKGGSTIQLNIFTTIAGL